MFRRTEMGNKPNHGRQSLPVANYNSAIARAVRLVRGSLSAGETNKCSTQSRNAGGGAHVGAKGSVMRARRRYALATAAPASPADNVRHWPVHAARMRSTSSLALQPRFTQMRPRTCRIPYERSTPISGSRSYRRMRSRSACMRDMGKNLSVSSHCRGEAPTGAFRRGRTGWPDSFWDASAVFCSHPVSAPAR